MKQTLHFENRFIFILKHQTNANIFSNKNGEMFNRQKSSGMRDPDFNTFAFQDF